jgi:dipeptidyl-peptidase-4
MARVLYTTFSIALLAVSMLLPVTASGARNVYYSIADIFGEPGLLGYRPENLKWNPNGKYLSFLLRHKPDGRANLYLIDTTTGKRSLLLTAKQLAGAAASPETIKNQRKQERLTRYGIASYHWSPKGDAIFFLSRNQVYLYGLKDHKIRQLTHEPGAKRNPRLSPNERWVSYVTNGDLHYVAVAGGKIHRVVKHRGDVLNGGVDWVYREELGVRSGYEWSPDSSYIAFMRFDERPVRSFPLINYVEQNPTVYPQKYPQAGAPNPIVRLGVYDVGSDATAWIGGVAGTADTYLARIGWEPKSGKLYAEVLNRAQTSLRLFAINPENGGKRMLFHETDPWWVAQNNSLHFLGAHHGFILTTFRDGWKHIDLFGVNGKLVRDLTPGSFNVQSLVGVDTKQGYVYYTAALDGSLDTHLYRVSIAGGKPKRLTRERGTHSIDMSPNARFYVDTASAAAQPPRMSLHAASGGRISIIQPAKKLPYHFQRPRFFTIEAANGKTDLYAQMIVPPNFNPHKKYPVIMYQYGGPHEFSVVRNAWGGRDFLFNQILARDGFILFAVDNRAAGYFSHKAQAQVKYHLGKLELADQLAALKWLKAQPYVEPDRIGIWGWSYGGYMTIYELTHAPDAWAAGIAVAPVTRWQDYDSIYTERYMGTPQKDPKGYAGSSSVAAAGQLARPLLLVAGTGDDNVHWQNTIQFIQALIDHGKPYQLLIYPNKTHGISGPAARTHLFTAMKKFWEIHLKR